MNHTPPKDAHDAEMGLRYAWARAAIEQERSNIADALKKRATEIQQRGVAYDAVLELRRIAEKLLSGSWP